MFKKWFEIISDHRISLQERMFRVVTSICMIALIIVLPMGRNLMNLVILAASLVCIAAAFAAVSHKLFYSRRILQRNAGMVCALFYLYQHYPGGKT